MKDISIKISNYKCFGDIPQGFDIIKPVNILIGRNNSGKSSLLDLVNYVVKPYDLSQSKNLLHQDKEPQVTICSPLKEDELKKVFKPDMRGGGIPGNHWEFGRKWVGKFLTFSLQKDGKKTFINLEDPLNITGPQVIAQEKTNPFKDKIFKRLYAERNIQPEPEDQDLNLHENGIRATNIIQHFINRASFPSEKVEKVLLKELNKILEPDLTFNRILVQKIDNSKWEIYLEEEHKGRVALSTSGSGLKTIILVLIFILLVPHIEKKELSKYIFAFEELENNLHPALQRKLLLYLREIALKEKSYFFLTTHSNIVIDLFSNDNEAQIYHIKHNGRETFCNPVKTYIEKSGILDDLDIRASDLLQANGVIWVEGPSDRIYFNRWIEIWSDGTLREGTHYKCVFYGGRLLAHLSAEIPEEETRELIKILLINRNAIILIDSDKKDDEQGINNTKKRITGEIKTIDGICWITQGREVENYIPLSAISSLYTGTGITESIGQYEDIEEYLGKIKNGEGKNFKKVLFAEKIRPYLNKDDLKKVLDLDDRLNEIIARIKKWNRIE